MTLKRFFVIFPVLFMFMIVNVFSFGAIAEDSSVSTTEIPPIQSDCYPSNDYIESSLNRPFSDTYLIVYSYKVEPPNINYDVIIRTCTYYIDLHGFPCTSLETPNGSWYFFDSGGISSCSFAGNYFVKDGEVITCSVSPSSSPSLSKLAYDPDLEEVYVNDGQPLLPSGYTYLSVVFCFNGEIIGKSSIEVNSFPKLEGKSTLNMYQLNDDGTPDFSKPNTNFSSTQLIDVDIINNTNDDYQFALYFVEKGGKLRFYESMSDFTVGAKFFSNNPQFIYITDEWYYYSTESFSHSFIRGPSAWHIVSSGSTVTCHVGENQLQLKKDIEYDIVVIGCPATPHNNTYFSPVDERYLISGIDPYINLNSDESLRPKELYRSTFYLDRDTAYKNTTMSNDENLSFSGGISYGFDPYGNNDDTFNTYYMKEDSAGSNHITEVLPQYGLHSFNSNLGSNDSWFKKNSSSSSSYSSSFIYRYSDFFGLVRSFLSSLPAEFMNIYIYGFTAVVVAGVVKAVK